MSKGASKGELGWESLLNSDAPSGARLKAALLTSYEHSDERMLVEHLLPMLLKLEHEPQGDGREVQYFWLELDARLKQMHGQVTVVSSTVRDEQSLESLAYQWIWHSIRRLTVGCQSKAVQHSKLWLLYWGAADGEVSERLEIVVSSANLTRSAFKGQIQAAWRVCLDLYPQPSKTRLAGWGVLPEFLRALAASTGNEANLDAYLDLLGRAEAPANATFLASVPGKHSASDLRRTPWGAAGLRGIAPPGRGNVGASILSPYVGTWNSESLQHWCANLESVPRRLQLIWIDWKHPWARSWLLPEASLRTLTNAKATVLNLRHVLGDERNTDHFHAKHRSTDPRWNHAKLYLLRRGNARRLLLTSANFSVAAWGRARANGGLDIDNFELGVCVDLAEWPFDRLEPFVDTSEIATTVEEQNRFTAMILWATAKWNGKVVELACRCANGAVLSGKICCRGIDVPIDKWPRPDAESSLYRMRLPWTDAGRQPMSVLLACGKETLNVPIFDDRPSRERETSIPDGVDPDTVQTMRDELLFEAYGGRAADDLDSDAESVNERKVVTGNGEGRHRQPDSYAVAAFVLARQHLQVVDNWVARMRIAAMGELRAFERQAVRRDGELLIEAFKRQAEREGAPKQVNALGATLAAEELAIRLKFFSEDA